jgi:hypothetical protein
MEVWREQRRLQTLRLGGDQLHALSMGSAVLVCLANLHTEAVVDPCTFMRKHWQQCVVAHWLRSWTYESPYQQPIGRPFGLFNA